MLKSIGMKLLMGLLICFYASTASGQASVPLSDNGKLDDIIAGVEKRYAGSGFSAHFDQTSTLKEMAITDTAAGKIYIKHPGMMRWEYEQPDQQIFITDSNTLWIYRPADNQVMVGEAPAYFGSGKGASFLSDMRQLRENFDIRLEPIDTGQDYGLALSPKEKKIDVSVIYLSVSKRTFDVVRIVTLNSYGDETRIVLSNFQYGRHFDNDFFKFKIPAGTDVLQLDQ